jgi:integrase
VTQTVPYIRCRDGVFYYERRVPTDIVRYEEGYRRAFGGRPLYRKSLMTKRRSEIHAQAQIVEQEFERLCSLARGRVETTDTKSATGQKPAKVKLRSVTPALLEQIAHQAHCVRLKPWIVDVQAAENDPTSAEFLEYKIQQREWDGQEEMRLLTQPSAENDDPTLSTPREDALNIVRWRALDAPEGSSAFSEIVHAVRRGRLAGEQDVDNLVGGQHVVLPDSPSGAAAPGSVAGLSTYRDAMDAYIAERGIAPRTIAEVRKAMEEFEQIVGVKSLEELTSDDFTVFLDSVAGVVVGGKTAGSIVRPRALQTIKKRVRLLSTVINHAKSRRRFKGDNPAAGLRVDAWVTPVDRSLMSEKRPFAVDELNAVFTHPWFTGCLPKNHHESGSQLLDDSHYWAPVVAAYTGCRASELGGLRLAEISLDGPIPYIHVRDNAYRPTKKNYERMVPVLDALLALGFGEYVGRMRGQGHDRLFPDWKPPKRTGTFDKDDARWSHASHIRSFNRTVVPNCLAHKLAPGARLPVTFHSFRGAFKTMLGQQRFGIPERQINQVIGHAIHDLDRRYRGKAALEDLYASMKECDYQGIVIPSRCSVSKPDL